MHQPQNIEVSKQRSTGIPSSLQFPCTSSRIVPLRQSDLHHYAEQLTSGTITRSFNRNGNLIPGVQPNFLNGRIIYDQPAGRLRGVGGYLEANYRDNFKLDNANLLDPPATPCSI